MAPWRAAFWRAVAMACLAQGMESRRRLLTGKASGCIVMM